MRYMVQRMSPDSRVSWGNCPGYANALSTLNFRVPYVAIVYCWAYSTQSDKKNIYRHSLMTDAYTTSIFLYSYRQYFSSTHWTDDVHILWKFVLADSFHVDRPVQAHEEREECWL